MKNLENVFKELNFEEIGKRLKAQRNALHMTREDVAEIIEVTPKFISDIEYGNRGMSLSTLYKFVQLYNMPADFILIGDRAFGEENSDRLKQIKENILGSLSSCKEEELRCMEQIVHYYARALKQK